MSRAIAVLSLLLLPVLGWTQPEPPEGPPAPPSAPEAAALLKSLPASLPGLTAQGPVVTYDRETLVEFLPEPESYFEFDYQWTVAGRFARRGVVVSVEFYSFSSALDGFGAFSLERDPLTTEDLAALAGQSTVGSAYWTPQSQLHVWHGPLYLRLVPVTPTKTPRPLVADLAAALVSQLPPPGEAPALFALPPTRGLLLESLKFRRRGVLGQPDLGDALLATYGRIVPDRKLKALDADLELVLFTRADAQGATEAMGQVTQLLGGPAATRKLGALGDAAFSLRHAQWGLTYVMRQGPYVAMLHHVKSPAVAEALLRELGTNIRRAQAAAPES